MTPANRLMMQTELALMPVNHLAAMEARYDWLLKSRPKQLPPEEYFTWLLLMGRGGGKTRAGAEDMWWPAWQEEQRVALIAPTNNDVRKTCFEGESGLLNRIPKRLIQNYNRSSLELWMTTADGGTSLFTGYSSEEPERLRGPQHHRAWCDELAAWKYLQDTWDMMLFGLRLGNNPTVVVTTTPKPSAVLREIMMSEDTVVSTESTFANANNLPKKILDKLRAKYEGTRLGRQELHAEILGDNPYALWSSEMLESTRVKEVPDMKRIVVAVDPPVSTGEDADECGIVVAGEGVDGQFYVLHDASVQGLSPAGWAREAVRQYHGYSADAVVAEINQGGDMVELTVRTEDENANVIKVRATRGKVVRAEPVAALYEQKKVHHLGMLGALEDQMCDFTTDFDKKVMGYSPDRVDALVWALTELALEGEAGDPRIRSL